MEVNHQIDKDVINRAVLWGENALSESKEFELRELKEMFKSGEESSIAVIIVDVEAQPRNQGF